ncbi:DASH family cryptochrome [Alteromonas mediterranea]|uniref:DASH family cryptochrome n=1 Tax=Alteromonas mediterranea TaxID=314275 RepID=UPI0011314CE9|nr:DASH family cryptochrome [Alteromonas mediterranea]QDG38578.1 DASH family cryptochrome [Alteromonas mediterranea]
MINQQIEDSGSNDVQRGVFWFRHDLRLHDQPAIAELCKAVSQVTFTYILDDKSFDEAAFGFSPMGKHRHTFLLQTLSDLKQQLNQRGHELLILKGNTAECIVQLLNAGGYTHLGVSQHCGFDETAQLNTVKRFFNTLRVIETPTFGLFDAEVLPFDIEDMPDVFSPFRRKVEKHCTPLPVQERIAQLPDGFMPNIDKQYILDIESSLPKPSPSSFIGGESAALKHLETYLFDWKAAATYKETRNTLDTWKDSTKLSAWLANGSLSAREVIRQVQRFEQTIEKNDSTYWIYFELLWREFFHWLQCKYGAKWFRFSGIQGKTPTTCHDPETFSRWCKGETGYPIVDACMRQLAETGYMSNRGRQLVASCFVHELRQDWRYGAAWFEHQLIDYDVGSNWGNWLYLAGVGSDPRGHRQFNLQKQTEAYDPDGRFRKAWL